MTSHRVVPRLAFLLLAAAAAWPEGRALAAELNCRPLWDYSIEVDGSFLPDACFYRSDVQGKWFINIPSAKDGYVMDLTTKRIVAVPRSRIAPGGDGVMKVQEDLSVDAPAFALSIDGPVVQFKTGSSSVRILPCTMRPPITGRTTIGELELDRPEYREGIKTYATDAASIETIRAYGKPVEVEAIFATWCGHCKEFMPKLLRVVKEAKNPRLKLDLIAVPRNFAAMPGPWQGKNVTSVPTIIVKIDGREITRMGSHEGAVPEVELAGILQAVK